MYCSTGVCGPTPNKALIDLNETLIKLQNEFKDLNVIRASLSINPNMFIENMDIHRLIREKGLNILPITMINGRIVAMQRYLTYAELKNFLFVMFK